MRIQTTERHYEPRREKSHIEKVHEHEENGQPFLLAVTNGGHMETGFIESHIKRGNRNLLVIGLVLTIMGGGLAFLSWVPALLAAPGVIALGCRLSRALNPTAHPIYKRLARYGDPQLLAQQVNREFAGIKSSDTTQFGATWLAQADTYGLSLVPWSDVAWLHIDITTGGG